MITEVIIDVLEHSKLANKAYEQLKKEYGIVNAHKEVERLKVINSHNEIECDMLLSKLEQEK